MAAKSQISATHPRRGTGRPFPKRHLRQSAGPKADFDIQALFRQHTDDTLKALLKALKDPKYRVPAAVAISSYGWGRPVAATEVEQTEDDRSTTFVLKIVPAGQTAQIRRASFPFRIRSSTMRTTEADIPEAFAGLLQPYRYNCFHGEWSGIIPTRF